MTGKPQPFIPIILVVSIIIVILVISHLVISTPKKHALATVNHFYTSEQDGDFYSSWSLFHSFMKEKFAKSAYFQERSHVFLNHFDVETFTFEVSKPRKVNDWQMSEGGPLFDSAYCMTVAQYYESKFGNFTIQQQVFLVMEEGEWRILWDYNR